MSRLWFVGVMATGLLTAASSRADDAILDEILFPKKEAVVRVDDKITATALEILSPCFARQVKTGKLEVHTTQGWGWGWVERGQMMTVKEAEKYGQAHAKEADGLFIRSAVHGIQEKPDKALADRDAALKLDPNFSAALTNCGWLHVDCGEFDKGLADFLAAIKADPNDLQAANNLAWFRATCPKANYRDGQQALAKATRVCEATAYKLEEFRHTLTAACTETGDFKSAVKWVTKAAEIAPDDEEFADHIKLFKSGKPLRDDAK